MAVERAACSSSIVMPALRRIRTENSTVLLIQKKMQARKRDRQPRPHCGFVAQTRIGAPQPPSLAPWPSLHFVAAARPDSLHLFLCRHVFPVRRREAAAQSR